MYMGMTAAYVSIVFRWRPRCLVARVGGIAPTARCLDVGCGGGDVTRELAQIASDGLVVGTDLDATQVEIARAETAKAGVENVDFRVDDVLQPPADEQRFDVVYARFLFTHLADPAKALENITARVDPGGLLIVEDIDCSGHFCYPPSPRSRATSSGTSRRLALAVATRTSARVCRGCCVLPGSATMEMVGDSMVAADVATSDEIDQTLDDLYAFASTEGTVQSLPRIVQTWGRRVA
jgi:2-polyprenyl-3-methyl-5-hydroxy-6-metoxy-1,4-benzoquinol methylase